MLEGGRRQLPASLLPLFSWLCSLSSDKVAGRTSSSISDSRDYLPYIDAEIPQPAWSHCSMAIPMSLFLYAFHLLHCLLPGQDFLPKGLCASLPFPCYCVFSPLSPFPSFIPSALWAGYPAQIRGKRWLCASHAQLAWEPSEVGCIYSVSDLSIPFLLDAYKFSWGIRFQTQTQTDSAQCRKLLIGFYFFCICDCSVFRGSVLESRGTHIFLKALGTHCLNLSGLQDPVWNFGMSGTGGSWTTPVCHAKRLGLAFPLHEYQLLSRRLPSGGRRRKGPVMGAVS